MKLYNFKFHLVTVVGIFLALALGIFIGSAFTEESIILQQRGTIEGMREDIQALQDQRRELKSQVRSLEETIAQLAGWLGDLYEVYWLTNPVAAKAVLIHDASFDPELLGPLGADVLQAQVVLESGFLPGELADTLVRGDGSGLAGLKGISLRGEVTEPANFVFLALDPAEADLAVVLARSFLDAQLPVIALGNGVAFELPELMSHELYNSVSHLDSPLGLYCLRAILAGKGGHYGPDNLLPSREVER